MAGLVLGVLAFGFDSHDALQFAVVQFFLGIGALIALMVRR